MLVTRNGIIIRSDVDKISVVSRNTQGVRLIALDEGDALIDVALCEKEEPEENGAVATTPTESTPVDGAGVQNVEPVKVNPAAEDAPEI
jgi:DNA gyrase subunit A